MCRPDRVSSGECRRTKDLRQEPRRPPTGRGWPGRMQRRSPATSTVGRDRLFCPVTDGQTFAALVKGQPPIGRFLRVPDMTVQPDG